MAILKASLDIFDQAGIHNLREKSLKLTSYLEFIFNDVVQKFPDVQLEIITPSDPHQRGAQLSIKLIGTDKSFFEQLTKAGVISDFRSPDVIRLAPAPLYNSFEDVYRVGEILNSLLAEWK
jgi:kynureninase